LGTLLLILFFIIFSAAFSSFETAIFSFNDADKLRLKDGGGVSALINRIIHKPRELLTTVLLGNELVNVAISILAGTLAYHFMGGYGSRDVYLISTALTTLVVLVFGEITPKNIAIRIPMVVAQVLVVPYLLFAWLVYPFRIIFTAIANQIVKLFGADPQRSRRLIVEEELRDLLELGRKEGTLADLERSLIQNALDLSNVNVGAVMTPREKMVAVSADSSLSEILAVVEAKRYSRLPVYERELNHVIGVLHAKELLLVRSKKQTEEGIRDFLKPYTVVSAEETLDNLFQEFQKKRIHMGIVKNKTGQVIGLITLDDLVQKLFYSLL